MVVILSRPQCVLTCVRLPSPRKDNLKTIFPHVMIRITIVIIILTHIYIILEKIYMHAVPTNQVSAFKTVVCSIVIESSQIWNNIFFLILIRYFSGVENVFKNVMMSPCGIQVS